MTECLNCRGLAWLRFDQPDGRKTEAPCWECPAGLRNMGVGRQFATAQLGNTGPDAALRSWDGRLPGWYLYGSAGVGKTHLAVAACRHQASVGRRPRFLSSARLLALVKATFDRDTRADAQSMLAEFEEADVVVLDDLGAERDSRWAESELASWIDDFYGRNAALIVTSNLDYAALAPRLGMRAASRLVGMTRLLCITGPDRRMTRSA